MSIYHRERRLLKMTARMPVSAHDFAFSCSNATTAFPPFIVVEKLQGVDE